ncbi:MFS general substrate transporter [Trichodelitschia bisporula]|uniref:MFS general substrate transporter n=1 Tax=Trichodelitschia bisporula TaxID=703511 RepID=A0A6G1HQS9_9PEZI|nr:MFS general substrate transporter [Trichodelitschia bisporula]
MAAEKFHVVDSPVVSSADGHEFGASPRVNSHRSVNERKLIRKIDLSILPVLMAAYFLQFLDKVVYNYANVMGMQKDIHMKGNDFTWGATAFFITYAAAELPQGALIQRFPVTKVLGFNILCWGIVLCGSSAVQTSTQMIAVRSLLGVFESVITPALIMITAAWYQRDEAAPRYGLWYSGLGLGQIIGGLISYGAQGAKTHFQGWRIMFLSIGVVNVFVAVIIIAWLPGTPEEAKFLTSAEKEVVARRLHEDHAGVGAKVLRVRSVLETFLDLQTWLLCLLTILNVIPSGVITTYSAILIKGFGYTSRHAALLNMPSGIVSIVALMSSTYAVRRGYQRWFAIICAIIPTLIGACLMSFLDKKHKVGLLVGIYLVNAAVAPYALILSTAGSNYRGYTRKVSGGAIIAAAFSIANIIGPQTFQAKDAPNYYPAKITLVATTSASIVVALALRLLYGYRNTRAEKLGEPAMSHVEAKAVRGRLSVDFADPGYRYAY